MNSKILFHFFILIYALTSCQNNSNKKKVESSIASIEKTMLKKEKIDLNLTNSFRGMSILEDNTVWISGNNGTVLRTIDEGLNWDIHQIPGAEKLDFRDIEAFSKDTAFILSAGFPGKIYKTIDGGKNWKTVYENLDSAIFFDGFEFWDKKNGIAYGDPINEGHLILTTHDSGNSWQRIPIENLPKNLKLEAGFAASGTGIVAKGKNKVWIGFGGYKARVLHSKDGGASWTVNESPILSGTAMQGIYSMAFKNEMEGIAVGGEWNNPKPTRSKAFTIDGGKTWKLGKGSEAYRSGSCYVHENIYIATGTSGTDISYNGGKTWELIDSAGWHTIEFSNDGKYGFAVGKKGEIVKVQLVPKDN